MRTGVVDQLGGESCHSPYARPGLEVPGGRTRPRGSSSRAREPGCPAASSSSSWSPPRTRTALIQVQSLSGAYPGSRARCGPVRCGRAGLHRLQARAGPSCRPRACRRCGRSGPPRRRAGDVARVGERVAGPGVEPDRFEPALPDHPRDRRTHGRAGRRREGRAAVPVRRPGPARRGCAGGRRRGRRGRTGRAQTKSAARPREVSARATRDMGDNVRATRRQDRVHRGLPRAGATRHADGALTEQEEVCAWRR